MIIDCAYTYFRMATLYHKEGFEGRTRLARGIIAIEYGKEQNRFVKQRLRRLTLAVAAPATHLHSG